MWEKLPPCQWWRLWQDPDLCHRRKSQTHVWSRGHLHVKVHSLHAPHYSIRKDLGKEKKTQKFVCGFVWCTKCAKNTLIQMFVLFWQTVSHKESKSVRWRENVSGESPPPVYSLALSPRHSSFRYYPEEQYSIILLLWLYLNDEGIIEPRTWTAS